MRLFSFMVLLSVLTIVGCSQQQVVQRSKPAPKPILIDEYAVLDDKTNAPSLGDEQIRKHLETARAHYLKALKLVEKNDNKSAAKHFEAAVSILNDLVTHPDIDALPEYTRLSQSVIRDYEDKITSIDDLDSTSSFFVLRDKMFQEIELLPVAWRPVASIAEPGIVRADTLQIDLTENEAVQQTLEFFTTGKGRSYMAKWLARSGRFFPLYDKILAEEGAPPELKYLSMIESGLNPTVTSKAKAVGLWQFISATGKEYGMNQDWYRDERRDPEKATRAAARYLLDLYEDMGDWHLALASYNCGPGRMRRAIRKSDTAHYWIARNNLPRETQRYVPLYIAAAKIARDPELYGFTDIVYEQPDAFDTLTLQGGYTFDVLAQAAGCSVSDLRNLNPELLRDQIPPSESDYVLRVPSGLSERLAIALDTLPVPQQPEMSWVRHKVERGETVTRIASRYGVSVSEVLDANGMTAKSTLIRGKVLRIPVRSNSSSSDNVSEEVAEVSTDTRSSTRSSEQPSTTVAPPPATTAPAPASAKTESKKEERIQNPTTTTAIASAQELKNKRAELIAEIPTAERKSEQSNLDEFASAEVEPVTGGSKSATPKAETKQVLAHVETEPTQRSVTEKKAEKKPTFVTHKVSRGETLSGIADKYGVSINDIKEWNARGITASNDVLLGAKLKIYSKGSAPKKSSTSVAASKKKESKRIAQVRSYKVRRGETLNQIATKFGVSVRSLRNNNPRLNPNRIRAGEVIRIR
ncbi:MAG: LysM peptidoglycan-binding domain-containing protein [Candidatus Kapaibacterium sp.]